MVAKIVDDPDGVVEVTEAGVRDDVAGQHLLAPVTDLPPSSDSFLTDVPFGGIRAGV